ncbi:unnamed protein product, partial [Owenia fusiformis]
NPKSTTITKHVTTKLSTEQPLTTNRSTQKPIIANNRTNITPSDKTMVHINNTTEDYGNDIMQQAESTETMIRKTDEEEIADANIGLIAGSITGAFLFLLLIVLVAVAMVKCRQKANTDTKATTEMYESVDPSAVVKDTTPHVYSQLDIPYVEPQPSYVNTTFASAEPVSSVEYEVVNTKAEIDDIQGRSVVHEEVNYEVVSVGNVKNKIDYENVANGKVKSEAYCREP